MPKTFGTPCIVIFYFIKWILLALCNLHCQLALSRYRNVFCSSWDEFLVSFAMFYYNIIEMPCLFLLLVFAANILLYSNVFCLRNVLLDRFQQHMIKRTSKLFFLNLTC